VTYTDSNGQERFKTGVGNTKFKFVAKPKKRRRKRRKRASAVQKQKALEEYLEKKTLASTETI